MTTFIRRTLILVVIAGVAWISALSPTAPAAQQSGEALALHPTATPTATPPGDAACEDVICW